MCFSLLHFPNGTVGDGERSGHRAIFRVAGLLKSACSSWLFLQFVDFVHPCPQAGPVRAPTEKTVAGIRTAVTLQRMAANRRRQRHLLKAGDGTAIAGGGDGGNHVNIEHVAIVVDRQKLFHIYCSPYFLKNQLRGQLFDTAPELCRLSPDFLS